MTFHICLRISLKTSQNITFFGQDMKQIEVCQRLTTNLQSYLLLIGLAEKSMKNLPFGFVSSKYGDIYN